MRQQRDITGSESNRHLLQFMLVVAILATGATAFAGSASSMTRWNWKSLDTLCATVKSCIGESKVDPPTATSRVRDYCALASIDPTDGKSTAWSTATIPSADDLAAAGACKPPAPPTTGPPPAMAPAPATAATPTQRAISRTSNRSLSDQAGVASTALLDDFTAVGSDSSSVGPTGLNQSAILWGATDFLLQRAGDEANLWFVGHFVADVCHATFDGDLTGATFFPKSCAVLDTLAGASVTRFPAALVALRSAMRDDLYFTPYAVLAYDAREKQKPGEGRDGLFTTALLSFVGASVLEGNSDLDAILMLSNATAVLQAPPAKAGDTPKEQLSCTATPVSTAVYRAAMFLGAFYMSGALRYPSGANGLRSALLAYQLNIEQLKVAVAWPSCTEDTAFDFDPNAFLQVGAILKAAIPSLQSSAAKIKAVAKSGTSDKLAVLGSLVSGSLTLLHDLSAPLRSDDKTIDDRVTKLAPRLNNLAQGNLLSASEILTVFLGASAEDWLPPDYTRLINLAADVVVAQDPQSVQNALAQYAAPASAYKTKHAKGHLYAELNGYVAAGGGFEWIKDPSRFSFDQRSLAGGPALPIGVELGVSTRGGSFGLLLQAVDLGALATYRFKQTDTSQSPQVGFAQVLSPGAYLAWGVPKAPLSILAGADLVPHLRTVGAASSPEDVLRFSLRIGFDVPIFP